MNTAVVVGPSLAGVLIAAVGVPTTYAIDVGSYAASFLLLRAMRGVPPPPDAKRPSIHAIVEGVRYARSRQELLGTYFVDIVAMFFGMPEALFPAFAARLGGPHVLGLLYAAPAGGAILASVASGWTKRVRRHGLAVVIAATIWGAGTAVFGAAPGLALALVGLVVAGAADCVSGIFRTTIWNQTIPDRIRGRLAGIEMISYSSGPLLGNVESGLVASLAGIRVSAISGGLLCMIGVGLTAIALPVFRAYDARAAPAAQEDG
jgi:MFS family permease